jgi:hypothetical protein
MGEIGIALSAVGQLCGLPEDVIDALHGIVHVDFLLLASVDNAKKNAGLPHFTKEI